MSTVASALPPDFRAALLYWLRLGLLSFGGPAGQIALMQHDLVERRRWIAQPEFLRALNFCMLLPGPEAQQLATYIGWRLHGVKGAVAAGTLFVLPGAAVLYALSVIAAARSDAALVSAALDGLKPVVVGIVAHALWRIGRRTLRSGMAMAFAGLAFLALEVVALPFPAVVLAAAIAGWFLMRGQQGAETSVAAALPPLRRAVQLTALYVVLAVLPTATVILIWGGEPFLAVARFFTQAAFVTFGGAYAVLPYVADAAVERFAWLSSEQMIDGLALAETTPGPLILVLQYVGFFAGWNQAPAALSPFVAATIAAALTTYLTFLPSIFFILIGAPYVDWIGRLPRLSAALAGITAAVVGVIASLGWFLASAVFMGPAGLDVIAVVAASITFLVLMRFDVPLPLIVVAGGTFGILRALAM